jgi:hypothetical protein
MVPWGIDGQKAPGLISIPCRAVPVIAIFSRNLTLSGCEPICIPFMKLSNLKAEVGAPTWAMKRQWICICLGWLLLLGQLSAQDRLSDRFPSGCAGAQALLQYILQADEPARAQLTEELAPTQSDCEAVFIDKKLARKVFRYQRYLYRRAHLVVRPHLPRQTQWLLWSTDADQLRAYQGEARHFPGGYHELADQLRPGLRYYRFKFIEPGRKMGSAYDMLVFVNGHWRMIHRPWVLLLD